MMPEYYCNEYMNNDNSTYMPKPLDFFSGAERETQADHKPSKPIKNLANYSVIPYVKQVGGISIEERREKIRRYIEKKRRRNYAKKVGYACRKRVADSRMRVKGRFISKDEAARIRTDTVSDDQFNS
jgi:hypothetical protein